MSDCIIWAGAKAGKGYGVTSRNGRQVYVHRLAAEEAYGSIPRGMVVLHTCDNPACFNAAHLRIGTQSENMADMRAKGRSASGARHRTKKHPELVLRGEHAPASKLTAADVLAIRAAYQPAQAGRKGDNSLSSLAEKYGVGFQAIHKIVTRTTWKHL